MYYGLNIGWELKDFIVELGFTSFGAEMHNEHQYMYNYSEYSYDLINQSVVLYVGYKIL
ncbi:MAG: hypothetical protein LBO62_07445 [Endomicrobium sp.]|nr:hypothetical protein [Endomicrobium sp.]